MNQLLQVILILFIVVLSSYLVGKFFAKGLLKEIDLFLGKKFVDYINKSKKEKDDNKEETK
jgi:peptide deformylase